MLFLLAVVANCRLGRSMDGCAIGFGGAILASWRAMAAASSENASRSVLCTSSGVGSASSRFLKIPRAVLSIPQFPQLDDVLLYTV